MSHAIIMVQMGLSAEDLRWVLTGTDFPTLRSSSKAFSNAVPLKGLWRIGRYIDPELRETVLALLSFHDLEAKIREHNGDRDAGIAAFLAQNDGEGWLLPETLRLADYGLGHDDRAKEHQPVASRLGPRFYDWQLAQTAEESWRECHLHARNLLGEEGYQKLLADIKAERSGVKPIPPSPPAVTPATNKRQFNLFD
jgi:DNA-binding PucR family transcriptional regulator